MGLKSSRLQGSCQQGRLVVCGSGGVVVDQQPLEWVDSIRYGARKVGTFNTL